MPAANLTEQEFKEWTDDLQYIILDCHISIGNFEALLPYLHKGADWQPLSGFLDHLRTQYYFTIVTQLAKLFCEGAHTLRFTALMKRLSAPPISPFVLDRFQYNMHNSIYARLPRFWKSEQEMHVGLKKLKQEIGDQKTLIERLRKCRNQVIAHTDSIQQRRHSEEGAPSLAELKLLAKIAAETHNLIRAGLGLSSFIFDTTGSWDISPVFRGWSGFIELHNFKGDLMHMGYSGVVKLDRASFDLNVVAKPEKDGC